MLNLQTNLRRSSLAALAGTAVNYAAFFALGWPLGTEAVAEWIMAETPSAWAVPILDTLGAWAKPWAMTGGLAALGFFLFVLAALPRQVAWAMLPLMAGVSFRVFEWTSWPAQLSFWLPAALVLWWPARRLAAVAGRRELLTSAAMASGTLAVAGESFLRDRTRAASAAAPVALSPFTPPPDTFATGLVRRAITPVGQFYVMSKNSVDPVPDPRQWRLTIQHDGRVLQQFRYGDLLERPRVERYQTLRCVSNTLKSDLMSTAHWSGVRLRDLIPQHEIPPGVVEAAVLGVDGHGDSFSLPYAFDEEFLLALGMNGQSLTRNHGFPVRLLAPRYYGFKNIKWIGQINFVTQPYFGTWPKRGFSKEPVIHTMSHIDRWRQRGAALEVGGVAFAGSRGIQRVEVRTGQGAWTPAVLEPSLSPYTWTRWHAELPAAGVRILEARAQDGRGQWQRSTEKPQFPDGVAGPTIRQIRAGFSGAYRV